MDESYHTLEAELKAQPLPRASARLLNRLESDLSTSAANVPVTRRDVTATSLNSWKWSGWRVAGLAAALAFVATVGLLRVSRPATPDATAGLAPMVATASIADSPRDHYQPVAATNVLYDLTDEGLVSSPGDNPTRRVRARYLDTYTWKNPTTNASLRWSVPRDEIRLVSATLN